MPRDPSLVIFATTMLAFLAGWYAERWRARLSRKAWRANQSGRRPRPTRGPAPLPSAPATPPDAVDQLRAVMGAVFEKRRLMSRSEARVFYAAENAIAAQQLGWRVMAQVSLGEILSSPSTDAYRAINSKRVDMLVISGAGEPLAVIEYQGAGHYQGSAPARDAVKKEALRIAGVRYIEITPDHGADDMAREIARLATAIRPAAAQRSTGT